MLPEEIYNIFLKEFSKDTNNNDVLVSFLCTYVHEYDKELRKTVKQSKTINAQKNKKRIAELEDEIERLKSKQANLMSSSSLSQAPAISVVIPMYNAEEYIGECLDSLLLQTFQDFEVIVADDCSTDNSVKIAEDYELKFDGRFKIVHTKKNSGGGGYIPRNLGLTFSHGEYVIFLDSDDFLLGSALETLYNEAKKYDADVVYSSTYYNVVAPNNVHLYRDGFGKKLLKKRIKDQTEFTFDDRDKIFKEFLTPGSGEGNFRHPWSKFVRRDFLIKNEIKFPDIVTGGDCIWCINVYAYAKRFLRLPTPLYFYRRYNSTSLTRTMRTPAEQVSYWVAAFIAFLKALNELQDRTEFLRKNPFYCYEATRGGHFKWCLNRTEEARKNLSNQEIYELLYREFSKEKNSFEAAVPFFFSVIDDENRRNEGHSEPKISPKFDPYLTARLDIQFVSKIANKDFQILSVSDNNAEVTSPDYLQKEGIGYQVQSYAGNMEIIAKSTVSGKVILKLKGMDIRNPKDSSKRVPYWIDYTKLNVNGKEIFDKVTPAWHDKLYRHTLRVKAGE